MCSSIVHLYCFSTAVLYGKIVYSRGE